MHSKADESTNNWNIPLAFVLHGTQFAWLHIPIALVFYQSRGVTIAEVFLLKSILSIAAVFLEVPTGYFADRVGRRPSILLGGLLCFTALLCYTISWSFSGFLVAELLLGAGFSFISGADSALVFDTLKDRGREQDYVRVEGRLTALSGAAEAGGGLLGAYLASINLVWPYLIQAGLYCVFVAAALGLQEPRSHLDRRPVSFLQVCNGIKTTFLRHAALRRIVLLSALLSTATFLAVWFSQVYMEKIDLPLEYFGVAWATFHLTLAAASLFAHRFDRRFGQFGVLFGLVAATGLSYAFVASTESLLGLLGIVTLYAVRGVRTPLSRTWVNAYAEPSERATLLSVSNFCSRLSIAVIGAVFGYFAEAYSLSFALVLCGAMMVIPSFWFVFRLRGEGRRTTV